MFTVVLLADEPAWGLDPLNTYFIISILSNYTKKYGRIVILTMEKPRSDIFPFLDRYVIKRVFPRLCFRIFQIIIT